MWHPPRFPCKHLSANIGLEINKFNKACDTLINLIDNAQSGSIKHRVAVDILNMTLRFMELGMLIFQQACYFSGDESSRPAL